MKLSKADKLRKNEFINQLARAENAFTSACQEYNDTVRGAWQLVENAQADYNAAVIDANNFRDDVASEISSYIDDKSDNWRDSERGSAHEEWKSQWETELEEASLDEPEEIPTDLDSSAADVFGEFEDEPNV